LRMGGTSATDWQRARARAGIPRVIVNEKDMGN